MPNEFDFFDPDDLDEYEPSPYFRAVAIGLLAVMALFSLFTLAVLFA